MKYRRLKGYKYQLAETFSISVPVLADVVIAHPMFSMHEGTLTVNAGYCWDGASGPTWDDDTNMTPSLVHDVLYQALRHGLLAPPRRADADYALAQLCAARGMPKARWLIWFTGLSIFGFNAAKLKKTEPQDDIRTAP